MNNDIEKIKALIEKTYQEKHEYRKVTLEEFPYLNKKFYEDITNQLVQREFKILGDIENVTISKANPSFGNKMFIKQPTIIQDNGMIGYIDGENFHMFLPGSEQYKMTVANWDGSYKVIEKPLPSSSDSFPWVGQEIWWNNYYSDGYNKHITIEKGKGEMVAGRETIRYETTFIGTQVDFVDKEHKILLKRIAPGSSQSLECKEIKFGPVSETYFSKP